MGKIFCLMGKSASGKDTIYHRLLNHPELNLLPVIPCTTRPARQGEKNGVDYYFYTDEEALALQEAGRVIEMRTYQTVHGPWRYFTADDGQIDPDRGDYLLIATPEAYENLAARFGKNRTEGLYIWVEDGVRLQRALSRERKQQEPKYAELCRRFLADEDDFSEERLKQAGVTVRFENDDPDQVTERILQYIKTEGNGFEPLQPE